MRVTIENKNILVIEREGAIKETYVSIRSVNAVYVTKDNIGKEVLKLYDNCAKVGIQIKETNYKKQEDYFKVKGDIIKAWMKIK